MPFAERIRARLLDRLAHSGADAAQTYAVTLLLQYRQNHRLRTALLGALPPDLAARVVADLRDREKVMAQRQAAKEAAIEAAFQEQKERERERMRALIYGLEQARRMGQVATFLAALDQDDRRACGATRAEIAQSIALRKTSIRSTRVKEILGCTDTELRRWSEDGRLPVLFRRRMPSSTAGKMLDVRHWMLSMVMDAVPQVPLWRDEDRAALRARRGQGA